MKLEDQVTSLDLCRRLKELGVKQESYFWWVKKNFANDPPVDPWIVEAYQDTHAMENTSAFAVPELGEMLPINIRIDKSPFILVIGKTWMKTWVVSYRNSKIGKSIEFQSEIEADARARTLIYLIEQKLLKP